MAKIKIEQIEDLNELALKTNVLELDNTTSFTPDADYEPATKKYVDDNAGSGTPVKNNLLNESTLGDNLTSLWLACAKAAFWKGFTYVTFIDYDDDLRKVARFNHESRKWSAPVAPTQTSFVGVGNTTPADEAHAMPTIFIDSSGYIYLSYTGYKRDQLFVVKSSNIGDITTWDSEVTIATGTDATDGSYPTLVEVNSTLVMFYRGYAGSDRVIRRAISTNGGTTWTNDIVINDYYPYFIVRVDDNDRVHLAWHDKATVHEDLYYMYSDDADAASPTFKDVTGSTQTLPTSRTEARLFDSSAAGWETCYIHSMDVDASGKPHIFALATDTVVDDKLLYFEYTSGWNEKTIAQGDDDMNNWGSGAVQGDCYIEGNTIKLLTEKLIDSKAELYEYVSPNAGVNWYLNEIVTFTSEVTTANSFYVRNSGERMWFSGSDSYGVGKTIHHEDFNLVLIN